MIRYSSSTYPLWLSCMQNERCKSRGCPGGDIRGDKDKCSAEVFDLLVDPYRSGMAVKDGDILRLKNPKKTECVANRGDTVVDMRSCGDTGSIWKIHRIDV